MRNFCIATVVASLILPPMALAAPLAPGKPAGVRAAQYYEDNLPLILVGAAVAVAIVVAASNSGHRHRGNDGGGMVTPPTTT